MSSPHAVEAAVPGRIRASWRSSCDARIDEYPHIAFGSGQHKTVRYFPDKLPIGIDKEDTSRFVFLYLVNRRIPVDFRQFLIRHHTLFLNLHTWTVRLLVPRRFRKAVALYKAALREELWTPVDPSVSKVLETYFRERKERGGHLGEASDRFIAKEFRRQGMAKIAALYRAWRPEGDVVLWRSSSTSLRDDRMHGCSACEIQNLDAQYLQFTKAIDREAWAKMGAKRKSCQVGPPVSTPSHDVVSPLVAPAAMARRHSLPASGDGAKLPDMVGAVIYVRISTKEQTENLSLPTQLRACEEYCRRHGYEILERFHEEGESA